MAFWSHDDIEVAIATGVDEVGLALVADAYSRTYRSQVSAVSDSEAPIMSRNGLKILPDRASRKTSADRTIVLGDDESAVVALDSALQSIEESYGAPTADFVALQIEYPRPR
jgi:hypothetical protein